MNQNIVRIILAGGLAFTSSLGVFAKEEASNKKEDIIIEETLDTNKDISLEKAKEIALNKIKGQIMNSYQDDDEYQIIVEKDNKYYEIEVDKITGEIDDIEIKKQKISLEKAKELALKKVNGTIKEIQEENDEYQIIIEKNNDYYEIEIDKETGKIEDIEKEKKKTTLSKKQIKEIALNKINGSIKDIEYDDGDYCVEIIKENNIYEVEIDGQNGNILEIEKDD